MKSELKITTAIAAALLAGACSSQADNGWETADRDTAICSDKSGNRVPDANCQQRPSYGGGGVGSAFLWYYLGRNSAVPYYGGASWRRVLSARRRDQLFPCTRRVIHVPISGNFTRWVWGVGAWLRRRWRMIRREIEARADWREKVEADGLIWHTANGQPYWCETAYYSFTGAQIAEIETATAELYRLFLAAGQAIVDDQRLLDRFGIPQLFHRPIRDAWDAEPPALNFGRFDLGYDGNGPPKLFEFNCDTPTSLLEAAVVQWSWKEERFPHLDQFTSLHDKLVAKWTDIRELLPPGVLFAHVADNAGEDTVTTSYLRDTAEAAGIETGGIVMADLGWDSERRCFVDAQGQPIATLFKLYPWEWLVNEEFGPHLVESLADGMIWIEPIWKMIWSNKAILSVLWEMFPDHPNLLATTMTPPRGDAVAKPLLAREGANVSIRKGGSVIAETAGDYGEEGFVFQSFYPLPEPSPGVFPVIGSWVVDGAPAGMGIREDGLITGNTARFVPHVIEG